MISIQELRVGNWVDVRNSSHIQYREEPRYTQVETIGYNGINISSSYDSYECDYKKENLYGIPLTPTILEKCGFKEIEGNIYYSFFDLDHFRVFIGKQSDSIFAHWKGNSIESTIDNLPLHTLQNLIYSLTKKELPIDSIN